jgi:ABC-2 type transport system ATP-binding protein
LEVVLDGVSKKFGSFQVLDKVSFRLEGRGCFGYLGPNGAGKTTSMKVLTSLIRPNEGTASINGIDVVRNPTGALRHVGSLVEDPEPYPFMTVREFITFAANIRGIRNPPVDQLDHTLDLPPLGSKCSRLSKGQKRRVFLGAILAQDPEVLILDEPTAGLDPAESIVFRNLIMEAKKEKLVFISSHLLYEITQLCEYVTFINKGRIVESGRVEDVTRRFSSRAISVEFNDPIDEGALKGLQSRGLVSGYAKDGEKAYTINFDGKEGTRRAIVDEVVKLGIRSLQDTGLGLEQAFLELMGAKQ